MLLWPLNPVRKENFIKKRSCRLAENRILLSSYLPGRIGTGTWAQTKTFHLKSLSSYSHINVPIHKNELKNTADPLFKVSCEQRFPALSSGRTQQSFCQGGLHLLHRQWRSRVGAPQLCVSSILPSVSHSVTARPCSPVWRPHTLQTPSRFHPTGPALTDSPSGHLSSPLVQPREDSQRHVQTYCAHRGLKVVDRLQVSGLLVLMCQVLYGLGRVPWRDYFFQTSVRNFGVINLCFISVIFNRGGVLRTSWPFCRSSK